jgi:hypothetical protein
MWNACFEECRKIMDMREKMVQRLTMLFTEGYNIIRAFQESRNKELTDTVKGLYVGWHLGSRSFFETVFNADNIYRVAIGEISAGTPNPYSLLEEVEKGIGILRAAQTEINFGTLPGIEALSSAVIFEDFLEMAEHLLDQKYFAVVPSLVGAVLEDGLRKITKRKGITLKKDDSIAGLNTKLFDAKAYTPLVRKKIDVWNTIRNNADHGNSELNSPQDIGQMLEGVRGFLAEFLK